MIQAINKEIQILNEKTDTILKSLDEELKIKNEIEEYINTKMTNSNIELDKIYTELSSIQIEIKKIKNILENHKFAIDYVIEE